ncbi:MAG: histone deacetylase [Bacteroidetes bacterium]|nr:histone deacetylase [Bacteroidota bacterium]
MLKIFHSDRFVPQLPEGHRFPIIKYQLIREQLLYEGTVEERDLEESTPCEEKNILAIHDADYWESMKTLSLTPRQIRRIGFPQSEQLVERSRRSCQGTFEAALNACQHGIGLNIAGGTHHAYRDRGEGFCFLNDQAITASYLLNEKIANQILIIDLDVHQGNGTASIFADDERVFTFSMHGADNYPLKKEMSDLDIPLPTGTEDRLYLDTLDETLPRLFDQVKPDFVFFQAGVDVLATDRLGKLSLTREGCKLRDRIVMNICRKRNIPLAVSIGGGYSVRLLDTVEAHTNTFRVARELF